MGQVLLVRHGQASWGADDYDVLGDAGREQSRVLGTALAARGVVPDVLLRGAMRRHRETAELVAGAAGWRTSVEEDPGWDEFDHASMLRAVPPPFGGNEPTREQFQVWFEEAAHRWTSGRHDTDYPESFAAFRARVHTAVRRIVGRVGAGGCALVVTSGGPISVATAGFLDPHHVADLWHRLNSVTVNGSVTKLVVGRRGTTLVSWNDHGHLEPGLVTYR